MDLFRKIENVIKTNIVVQGGILILVALAAFHQILSFWFYYGWEASWYYFAITGKFSITNLMQEHAFIAYFFYKLFGWNPQGWYAMGLLFHILLAVTLMVFVGKVTKNRVFGFVSALLFISSTAHHDVVTWGSFEALYSVQTLGFYLSLLCFYIYKTQKKRLFYFLSFLIYLFVSVFRESGIIFIPIVIIFQVVLFDTDILKAVIRRKYKRILQFIILQIPFASVGLLYLITRILYGGSPHDFIDERVLYRILLMHENRYLEYIGYGVLAFGQYIAPYLIPYPFVNFLRDSVFSKVLPGEFNTFYFFVIFGWVQYLGLLFILYKQRSSKYFRFLLFCFISLTIITIFYSFAWTTKFSFLATPYGWNENRWRYFGYTMFAPFLVISIYSFIQYAKNKKMFKSAFLYKVVTVLLLLYVGMNIFLHTNIQHDMYINNSQPQILFYQTFLKEFPKLSAQNKLYFYKSSAGLNDFMEELKTVRKEYYPNLTEVPVDWIRSEMYYKVRYLADEKHSKKDLLFVDFTRELGVKNMTNQVLQLFTQQKEIVFQEGEIRRSDNRFTIYPQKKIPVEFPVNLKFTTSVYLDSRQISTQPLAENKYSALLKYIPTLTSILNASTTDCGTMGYEDEPFYFVRRDNVIDGNINNRSVWWANCRPAWVTIDLKQPMEIQGFSIGAYNTQDALPRDYEYQVSQDFKNWKTVLTIDDNTQNSRIDALKNPITARYIRLYVTETSARAMLHLHEFAPIIGSSKEIFSAYSSQEDLYDDMYQFWDIISDTQRLEAQKTMNVGWAQIVYQTNPDNSVPIEDRTLYLPIILDGAQHTYSVELPDSEAYSTNGQYLQRFYSDISITFPKAGIVTMQNITLSPKFMPKE